MIFKLTIIEKQSLWCWNDLNIFILFFLQIDRDGSGFIDLAELKSALDVCGFKIPQWKVRQMIDEYDRDQSGAGKGRLSFDEFESVICI